MSDRVIYSSLLERIWRSRVAGRARTIGNRVYPKRVSRVQIPPSPPKRKTTNRWSFLFMWEGFEPLNATRKSVADAGWTANNKDQQSVAFYFSLMKIYYSDIDSSRNFSAIWYNAFAEEAVRNPMPWKNLRMTRRSSRDTPHNKI